MNDEAALEPSPTEPPALPEHTEVDFVVSESTRARLFDGVRDNTRKAYSRQWEAFGKWCAEQGRVDLPATAQTLAEYTSHLCDLNRSPATIEQAIATIRSAHTTAGLKGHPDSAPALRVLRGYRRTRAENGQRNQKQSAPVTIDALRAMVGACDQTTTIGVRDRLLLVLGLALMGRRSELVALTFDDVTLAAEGLDVHIRTSKTDKDSKGETAAIPRGSHPLTDPVQAWRDWINLLAAAGITSGRLLRSVDRHGRIGDGLGGEAVNRTVRRLAVAAGVPSADRYTAHSLRAGGATVAYAAGVPVSVIARHGRWDPKSPVVLGYIRAVDRWRENAMRNVGL
ncbi:tyrosine-type recombinase/integrase [Allonocardiopsis opalescens]|uniref:Site-specific recombinase XerD n=1 Tax=Allonocardiopsis opalescens TaxID=1144618 RepID=A0A2T0PSS1_9ACTN|nr:tyrosine-type recombinase/integrase [Allonocardiopsis opalescens]PRX91940.1 site-specific recombinase XerD [Allonocardiopsis opalescens]